MGDNPFALLSLIAAPAVLTNAASLLVLSTSNRFARAVDRARQLSTILSGKNAPTDPQTSVRLRQLARAEKRSFLLLGALRAFYLALGSFAAASLISLVGAWLADVTHEFVFKVTLTMSLVAGITGVGSLITGCVTIFRETRVAYFSIGEDARHLRERLTGAQAPAPPLEPG
jgi:hypothetical protein